MPVPTYDRLFNPLLKAIHQLGGSASITEQEDTVTQLLKLSEREVAEIHRGSRTKLNYRLAWARNYLKRVGLLENSKRGVWALTPTGFKTTKVDENEVKKAVNKITKEEAVLEIGEPEDTDSMEREGWEEELLKVVKGVSPAAFERLCQRVLRESGFVQVEVTGQTGDGGIDGKGVVRLGGLLSFHVLFQCKRYKNSVPTSVVRDFRGALVGRADKGLILTTGTFTRDARQEAQRDGATPIDLIDGDDLVLKMKELGIGVRVKERVIEEVAIDNEYFKGI